jgi:hypothetical protein
MMMGIGPAFPPGCARQLRPAPNPPFTGQSRDQQVIAHGWFGQTNEVTRWHKPSGPTAETGGTVLASTGANTIWAAGVALLLIGGGVALTVVVRRRRRSPGE